jgi:hypothetical protein
MMIFKVRPTADVLRTKPENQGTRRRTIATASGPRPFVFGLEPVYLRCDALPPEIATDKHLLATPVDAVDPGTPIIDLDLKAERVQADEITPPGDPGLKAERVQAAPAPNPKPTTKRR